MRKIQILVGNIASGRSTYCMWAARDGAIIVNDDAIVNMVHGNDYTLYNRSLKCLYKSVEHHIVAMGLAMNRPVVIDRGLSGSVESRQRWVALARSLDVPCDAVLFPFDCQETHARRRWQHDGRGHPFDYWLMVATAMLARHVDPTPEEGLVAVHTVAWEEIKTGKVFV